ncbi:MAG: hypothetical protein AB1696_12655 [Planctomycetota bacterium]
MEVKPCSPYASKVCETQLVKMPDGKSAFKVYFVDITGRDKPERYEWGASGMSKDDFLKRIKASGAEGIGFITAFPHITKMFTFGPSPETNLYTNAFKTPDLSRLDLNYSGSTEVACAAEMAIGAAEFEMWLRAESVEDYLARFAAAGATAFKNHAKLRAYWTG